MSRDGSSQIALAAALAMGGVVLGALGAHALEERLATGGMTAVWQTAVLYHLVHALALFALGTWNSASGTSVVRTAAAWLWVGGILLFSGSLFIAGWGVLFLAAWRRQPERIQ